MNVAAATPSRFVVAGVIARREAKGTIRGYGGYIALTVAFIAGTWILLIDVRALTVGGVLALADPFGPALTIVMLVVGLFLAVSAAVSAARDRESGTLEVLFYGPIDELSYIIGKVGGLLIAYVAALPLLLASFALLGLMTGLALTAKIVTSLLLSIVPIAVIIGFGVLLAVGASRVRTAVMLLIAVIAVFLGTTVAYNLVLLVPIADAASPILPLRDALSTLNLIVRWLSPFSYLERVIDGVTRGAWRGAIVSMGAATIYATAMIALAALWLRWRGVQGRGE